MEIAIVLMQCSDQKGIVAKVSDLVFRYGGNIIQSDQYTTDPENGRFFLRLAFYFDQQVVSKQHLENEFGILARGLHAEWRIHYYSTKLRMGILVSKYDHCLFDILYLRHSGELSVEIPFIISNHDTLREVAERYDVPFYHFPVTRDTKSEQEQRILSVAKDTDFLVLARYMQIISDDFLKAYGKDIINIHHSFLPSFKGANPYRQAYERGVKVIGATAHYVTSDLDEGPIIEQVVEHVSHRDTIDALKSKGRNLEKRALANAIMAHLEHRIIRFENKTIVFQ